MNPRASYRIVPDFTPLALPMREQVERHFRTPEEHGAEHQVWNYWHVPDSYTYLRTNPEKVIERTLVEQFFAEVEDYAIEQLGMDHVTWPRLSLYVDACGQSLHNDSRNGQFGYVFSLTRWDERSFSGGETQLFHDHDYWASGRFTASGATNAFYELVPATFNQLLVFDDRVPHSVPTVRGVSDPCAGRLVLHGHISARQAVARGPLSDSQGGGAWKDQLPALVRQLLQDYAGRVNGVVTFELRVDAQGRLAGLRTLVDRVLPLPGGAEPAAVVARIGERLSELRFDATDGESQVSVPFVFAA